jgi:hypothetical protein
MVELAEIFKKDDGSKNAVLSMMVMLIIVVCCPTSYLRVVQHKFNKESRCYTLGNIGAQHRQFSRQHDCVTQLVHTSQ